MLAALVANVSPTILPCRRQDCRRFSRLRRATLMTAAILLLALGLFVFVLTYVSNPDAALFFRVVWRGIINVAFILLFVVAFRILNSPTKLIAAGDAIQWAMSLFVQSILLFGAACGLWVIGPYAISGCRWFNRKFGEAAEEDTEQQEHFDRQQYIDRCSRSNH
jgi:hypothetical protein